MWCGYSFWKNKKFGSSRKIYYIVFMNIICSCPNCNISFEKDKRYVNQSIKNNWKIYCSPKCRKEARKRGVDCNCHICGKDIIKTPSNIKKSKSGKVFCSRSCSVKFTNTEYRTGKNNPNYKNGGSKYRNIKFRSCEKICEDCKTIDIRVLEVHHKDRNRKNNELSNLSILCANCHKIKHYKGVVG